MKLTLDTSTLPRPPRWAVALAAVGLIAGAVVLAERAQAERERQDWFRRCMRLAELEHAYSRENDTARLAEVQDHRRFWRCE